MFEARLILPALALVLGFAASVYFVVRWWRHRQDGAHARSLLLWAVALLLFYWFQVPAVLVGLGFTVTVTDFNFFFALTFPITFLALILLYFGILQVAGLRFSGKKKILFVLWFLSAVAFFVYYFISQKGIINTYALPLVGNTVFYGVIRVLIIITLLRLVRRPELRTAYGILGVGGIIVESAFGLMRNFVVIRTVLAYPPSFWYVALSDSHFFFVTQTLSTIFLVFGFYFLHSVYHRLRYGSAIDR